MTTQKQMVFSQTRFDVFWKKYYTGLMMGISIINLVLNSCFPHYGLLFGCLALVLAIIMGFYFGSSVWPEGLKKNFKNNAFAAISVLCASIVGNSHLHPPILGSVVLGGLYLAVTALFGAAAAMGMGD